MRDPRFEDVLDRFERAWRAAASPPDLRVFLEAASPIPLPEGATIDRRPLLFELIKIDLEYRWSRSATHGGGTACLDLAEYASAFPELGPPASWPVDLIAEEYRVRHRWGDRPTFSSYLDRFAVHRAELRAALARVDRELAAERDGRTTLLPVPGTAFSRSTAQPFDPRAPLPWRDYVLKRRIGAGGLGKVYEAWQRSLGRSVAIKFLRKSYRSHPAAVDRFLAEARTLAQLRHPNIIGVHGLGSTPGGAHFIVMDFVPGGDLNTALACGPVPIEVAIPWTIAAARALVHAHSRGIIHCDLKPANLLRDGDRILVTDFGLARSLAEEDDMPVLAGTPAFMAPEQIDPIFGPVDARTDVYGLGALLFTLLEGTPPYAGRSSPDVLGAIVSATVVPRLLLARHRGNEALMMILGRSLARDPADRYPGAAHFICALEKLTSAAFPS